MKPPPLWADRFWAKVNKTDGCWLWTGASSNGYGHLRFGDRCELAHRLSMVLAGVDVDGWNVLHECDNPPCVNPSHLFLGTQSDNAIDMVEKGRHGSALHPHLWARGERVGGAKLAVDDVLVIRDRHLGGETMASLGRSFGVTSENISRIVKRKTWRHI